jgi:ribosomal protein L11 methyltransferase
MHKITISVVERDQARTLSAALAELVVPAADAVTSFERSAGMEVEAYYRTEPDAAVIARQIGDILGQEPPPLVATAVPDINWVAVSQAALPAVVAGRFTVHGSHDRERVARGPWTIEIDAGEAFGTAHHATTHSCLLALDAVTRRQTFHRVLDLGCGSGVLAIAAGRLLPRAAMEATDFDPVAIAVACANARLNGLRSRLRPKTADGFGRTGARRRPYDLIVANILAEPLVSLAPAMAQHCRTGGTVILSGLVMSQARPVVAAYRSHGFRLMQHRRLNGWATLTLVRT